MSVQTRTITTVKCDVCGEKCDPVKNVRIDMLFGIDNVLWIEFQPRVFDNHCISRGDVCESCLVEGLKKYVRQIEFRNGNLNQKKKRKEKGASTCLGNTTNRK